MAQTSSAFSGIPNAQYTRLYLDFWVASQSIANNQTTFGYKLVIGGVDGGAGSTQGGAYTFSNAWSASASGLTWSWSTSSHKTIREGTFVVTHNADGTLSNRTLTAAASFVTYDGTATASTSVTISVPTIPRSSTLSLSTTSQNVGSDITWTINESYDYTHRISYSFGGTSGYILGSSSAASGAKTGTWTVPTSLANQMPNATSGSGTISIRTFYGNVKVGEKLYTFTAKVPNTTTWQPTVPSVTISDAATRPTGITSYVQGKSKANVISSSTAQGGASIKSYRVTVSGLGTYYGSNITSGYLTKSGTVTVTVRATDSRGYYRENVSTITVVPYSPPKLTGYTALRSPNSQGTDLAANLSFSISPVNNQNTKLYRIRYRPTGGTWVTLAESTDYWVRNTSPLETGVLDVNSSYEVEFYIKDSYTSVTQMRNIGTAFQLLDFNASGRGVAFGKVSESDIFEVALTTILPHRPILRGLYTGTDNETYLQFMESDGSTRQGWIGFGSSANDYLSIANEFGSRIVMNKDLYIGSNLTWHDGNVVYGSNSNGQYIKFPNGTQICKHSIKWNGVIANATASGLWTFPAVFSNVEIPALSITAQNSSTTDTNASILTSGEYSTIGNSSAVRGIAVKNTSSATRDITAHLIAIGRWE